MKREQTPLDSVTPRQDFGGRKMLAHDAQLRQHHNPAPIRRWCEHWGIAPRLRWDRSRYFVSMNDDDTNHNSMKDLTKIERCKMYEIG